MFYSRLLIHQFEVCSRLTVRIEKRQPKDERKSLPVMTSPVLLIEDEQSAVDLMCHTLRESWNVEIHIANNLSDAKELLKKHRQDYLVAICDLVLPDAPNGEIIGLVEKAEVRCIALTISSSESVANFLSAPNLIDYINKDMPNAVHYAAGLVGRLYKNQYFKVLVVDDSATAAYILEEMLNLLNFEVFISRNGSDGIDTLQRHPDIRLAITDYEMPEMNGYEFTTMARKTFGKEQLAIIGLSASGQSDLGSKFIKNGANDFLFKPYSFEELLCRVNNNIEALEHLDYIYELANKDSLTKLFNRRYFFSTGGKKYADNSVANAPMTVVMFDIDFFKKVNDTYGHDGGDAVLIHFAKLMEEHFADHLIARLGGEEFALVIENLDKPGTIDLLEGFRYKVEASHVPWSDPQKGATDIKITVSTGATAIFNGDLDNMLKTADENLYEAKKTGRNKVVLS